MKGVDANEVGAAVSRQINRLSVEIRQLTRTIPLLEGRLLERETKVTADSSKEQRLTQALCAARRQLQEAEVDLVALERRVRQDSRWRQRGLCKALSTEQDIMDMQV